MNLIKLYRKYVVSKTWYRESTNTWVYESVVDLSPSIYYVNRYEAKYKVLIIYAKLRAFIDVIKVLNQVLGDEND